MRPTDTAHAALVAMAEKRVGFLLVLDGEKLAGVISERDYTRKLIPSGRSAQDARVGDLMTREVVTVTLAHHVRDCVSLMDRHGIRHLPVVDGNRVVGVISVRDLLREAVVHHDKVLQGDGARAHDDLQLGRLGPRNAALTHKRTRGWPWTFSSSSSRSCS